GGATGSVVANSGLVKKVSFPREILPLASVGSMLVHFFLQSLVLFAVIALVHWSVAWEYLPLLPVALVALLLVTGALCLLLSATKVCLPDTQHSLELARPACLWFTPIVYPFSLVDSRKNDGGWYSVFAHIWLLNPVTPIVVIFQRAIYTPHNNKGTG